ncbi:Arc family DNA-binding protein [Ancylobacter oerskovii]
MKSTRSSAQPPFGLRMPPALRERVRAAAFANRRSINSEIVLILEQAFASAQGGDGAQAS